MPHRTLGVEQLTAYLHLAPGDVERLLRESDIPHEVRGGRFVFQRGEIDAWASRRILESGDKRLTAYHAKSVRGTRQIFPELAMMPDLLERSHIDLALPSKTKASVLRDMVRLADATGRVLDARELLASIEQREQLCSTALPGGMALLHARQQAEYRFDGSFIVLGRTIQAVPFGAPDGRPTQVFFLIGCEDDRIHLHTLARLCLMAMKTDVLDRLRLADTKEAAYDALIESERTVLPAV